MRLRALFFTSLLSVVSVLGETPAVILSASHLTYLSGRQVTGRLMPDTAPTHSQHVCLDAQHINPSLPTALQNAREWPCLQPASMGQSRRCNTSDGVSRCNIYHFKPAAVPGALAAAAPLEPRALTGPPGPQEPTRTTIPQQVASPKCSVNSQPGVCIINGAMKMQSVLASVNRQINVMADPYNAKGDCRTDDHAAIQAAVNAAGATNPPEAVDFPQPPGGCYLTSTIQWNGVSLIGQPVGTTYQGTVIRGEPGQDIIHLPDPNLVSTASPYATWTIKDLHFEVNASVNASANFLHRWPGRWFNDAAMTSGSAILTTANAEISCGDVGQNIQVNGAGVSGANLQTVIASVSPCGASHGRVTVSLAARASTTVSGAAAYITPAGISLSATVGNAAIAGDNKDGKSSDWTMTGTVADHYDKLWNVDITAVGRGNSTAAIYLQGAYGFYGTDVRNLNIRNTTYGVVEGCPETNSFYQSCSSDFQTWDHASMESVTYPWISYNGSDLRLYGMELTTSAGPQFLQLANKWADTFDLAYISIPTFEGQTLSGFRMEGTLNKVVSTLLNGTSGVTADWDAYNSTCDGCGAVKGTLAVNGSMNNIRLSSQINSSTITDNGIGNVISGSYDSSPFDGVEPTRESVQSITRGRQLAGIENADFLQKGSAPYFNNLDLFLWPEDLLAAGATPSPVADSNSWTGYYYPLGNGWTIGNFANLFLLNGRSRNPKGQIVIGQNAPAGKVILYASVECPSISSANIQLRVGSTDIGGSSGSCSSRSYTTLSSAPIDLSSYSGKALSIHNSSGATVNVAWLGIRVTDGADVAQSLKLTDSSCTSGTYVKGDGTGCGNPSSGVISGTMTGNTTAAIHNFATPFLTTPQCSPAPRSNVGSWYISTENTKTITVTYTINRASTWEVICKGTGGAW